MKLYQFLLNTIKLRKLPPLLKPYLQPYHFIWSTSSKKVPSNMRKIWRFRSSWECVKYHPGLCFPLIDSVVSSNSVSGQWRPWSDCTDVQADLGPSLCTYAQRHIFTWNGPFDHDSYFHCTVDFTEANNYVGVYSSDATYVGVTSIQQCAMYCRNFSLMATVPCMSFDYCSSKQLCQLSKSVTPDGNMLNQSTYCSHYSSKYFYFELYP